MTIVIGGSMAGLVAARVASDYFREVIVLDRDHFPPGSEHRRGVPQSRHTHGLLSSGCQMLESFFPGLCSELEEGGALPCDITNQGRWFQEGGTFVRYQGGLRSLLMS